MICGRLQHIYRFEGSWIFDLAPDLVWKHIWMLKEEGIAWWCKNENLKLFNFLKNAKEICMGINMYIRHNLWISLKVACVVYFFLSFLHLGNISANSQHFWHSQSLCSDYLSLHLLPRNQDKSVVGEQQCGSSRLCWLHRSQASGNEEAACRVPGRCHEDGGDCSGAWRG